MVFLFHPWMQMFYLPFWSQKIQVNKGKYSPLLYMCDLVAPVVLVVPVAQVVRVSSIQQPYFTLCCTVCDCVCDNTAWFDWLIRRWAVDQVRRWRWCCSICVCRSSEPPVGHQCSDSAICLQQLWDFMNSSNVETLEVQTTFTYRTNHSIMWVRLLYTAVLQSSVCSRLTPSDSTDSLHKTPGSFSLCPRPILWRNSPSWSVSGPTKQEVVLQMIQAGGSGSTWVLQVLRVPAHRQASSETLSVFLLF